MRINVRVHNPAEAAAVFGVLYALDIDGDTWGSESLADAINDTTEDSQKYPHSMQLDFDVDYEFTKNTRPGVPVAKFLEEVGRYGFQYVEAGEIDGHTVKLYTDGRVHVGCKKLTADDVDKIVAWFRKTAPKIHGLNNPESRDRINHRDVCAWWSNNASPAQPLLSIDDDGNITAKDIDRVMNARAKVMAKAKGKAHAKKAR